MSTETGYRRLGELRNVERGAVDDNDQGSYSSAQEMAQDACGRLRS